MRIRQNISGGLRDESGLAYLEFALVLPFLLLMFLGGLEISRYIQAGQKVDKLTHTVVDLITQAPNISVAEMDKIMDASQHVMSPYPFDDTGVVIVTSIGHNEYGQLRVKWQYKGGGTLARNSLIGEPGDAPTLPEDFVIEDRDTVLVAETFYTLQPMVNENFADPIEFYRTAYYLPRIGELDTLQP